MRKGKRERAQRLLSEVDAHLLLRAARTDRDRLLLEVAYYGALRVSELANLTWGQVLPRETGEAQLAIVGEGDKPRNVHRGGEGAAHVKRLSAAKSTRSI